jgi:uncharacterized protein
MSERTSYEPGTPSWVELAGIRDFEAAEGFYRDLLGWEIPKHPQTDELGGYRRAQLNGRDVAGASPVMQEGQPCEWNTYVSVADAEATMAKVREAGGTVIVEPLDVMGMGKMAIFNDTTGATCGVWEPGTFVGAAVVNEDGAFSWNELSTRDAAATIEFYGKVFGWTAEKDEGSQMGSYYMWKDGEEVRGGLFDLTDHDLPEEAPTNWLVYFTVPDTDAAVATTTAGGGELMNGPLDISVGRLAVLKDPQGALFAVLAPNDKARGEMK